MGTEAVWGQPVILGKESEELNKRFSRESSRKNHVSSQSPTQKKILEKDLKICTFISRIFSLVQRLSARGIKILKTRIE